MDEDIRLLTKICYMYYQEDKVQSEIAEKLGITRQTVSRMIQKARDEGIVNIMIQSPVIEVISLETQLEEKYQLKDAIVIKNDSISDEHLIEKLGIAAADFFLKVIMSKMKIGIGFGKIIELMAEHINDQNSKLQFKNVQIIQLVGDIKSNLVCENSQYIVSILTKRLQAEMHLLHAPFYVEDDHMRAFIVNEPTVQNVLEYYHHLDFAFVEIQSADRVYQINPKSLKSLESSYLSFLGINYLTNLDVSGEVCLNYFNNRGHFVDTKLSERLIGINNKQLSNVRNLVGVVGGAKNKQVALGALRTGVFNIIITDEDTAKFVLSQP